MGVTLMLELTFFPSSLFDIAIALSLLRSEWHAPCGSPDEVVKESGADQHPAPTQQLTTADLP
jgi:hypothetical protein